jgi:hypothetical protein
MGYHVYDLAEFELTELGDLNFYGFLFTQSPDVRRDFALAIGKDAVSVSEEVNEADCMFLHGLPDWASAHALYYATIAVLCPTKDTAASFLHDFRELREWQRAAVTDFGARMKPPVSLVGDQDYAVIAVPRTSNPLFVTGRDADRQSKTHDRVLQVLAELIRSGLARDALLGGYTNVLGERLELLSRTPVYIYKNALLVDALGSSVLSIEEQRDGTFGQLKEELRRIRETVAQVPQDTETNRLLKELKSLLHELHEAYYSKKPISLQASAGFEAFGNGVKVVFDSNNLPPKPIEKARALLAKLRVLQQLRTGESRLVRQ